MTLNEKLLSLFSEDTQKTIKDKCLTSESVMIAGKAIHIIYIADDEWVKSQYKKEFVKETKNEYSLAEMLVKSDSRDVRPVQTGIDPDFARIAEIYSSGTKIKTPEGEILKIVEIDFASPFKTVKARCKTADGTIKDVLVFKQDRLGETYWAEIVK